MRIQLPPCITTFPHLDPDSTPFGRVDRSLSKSAVALESEMLR
jgi:hypothetical protein